ncbi:unnamed protein product [Moneuplotes crassus]|uniref:Spindle pole body component n=1 Tax=Euplotes crassus TaxID=5936 RepID=A0AAD1XAF9_EUPCR|nr:unnamed protein product [Moneuplotes crassus]
MASNFKNNKEDLVKSGLAHLITEVCGIEEGTKNFQLAEEFALSNIDHHQFLDTNPNQVDSSITNLVEKFTLNNKEKEGKELKTLYDMFLAKKIPGIVESVNHSAILMLLCISESPARGSYTLPDNLNFSEKRERRLLKEQEALEKLEKEIKMELDNNEELKQIKEDWKREVEEEQDSDWSQLEDDEQQDMQIDDRGQFEGQPDAQQEFLDTSQLSEDPRQILKEITAAEFGATPIHYNPSPEAGKSLSRIPEERPDEEMDDDKVLHKLLKIRSFKEIYSCMVESKSRTEIEQEIQSSQPRLKESRYKSDNKTQQVESCIHEPMNLSYFYSNQFKENEVNDSTSFASKPKNLMQRLGPVLKWPYKTLTERLIINDILLMLKGLSNDTFKKQGLTFTLKEEIQVKHLSPLSLQSILQYFMKIAQFLLRIQDKIDMTNWSRVGKVYEGFQYSIIRNFNLLCQELNNLYTLFCMQSGKIPRNKCRISGKLVKSLEHKEITLISLKSTIEIIEPYVMVYYDMLTKAVPMNFDAFEEEKEKGLSDISHSDEESLSERSEIKEEMNSLIGEQLLTNEAKTVYLLNYLHSFININCSNIMDRELIEVIIEIFLDSLIPYMEIVDSWFKEDTFDSTADDEPYEIKINDLPRFLKPFMKEILNIRRSLSVIQETKKEMFLTMDEDMDTEFEQYRTCDFLTLVTKRIKKNIILRKSPLNLDEYTFEDLPPETLYYDKKYNIQDRLQQASQMQNRCVKLSSMETIIDRQLVSELKKAPFAFNVTRESGLENNFGIPSFSTIEMINEEGSMIPLQETYSSALVNQMSYGSSQHQQRLEKMINDYKGLKNYSEEELSVYKGAMQYYQDDMTFEKYLDSPSLETSEEDHYFYFKTSTLDSFLRECIIVPLKEKYDEVGKKFNKTVIKDFKLDETFKFIRQIYFMESGKDMALFSSTLFEKLDEYSKCDNENEINGILQESLRDLITDENADLVNSLEVEFPEDLVIPKYLTTQIQALDHINITFTTNSLLEQIFDSKSFTEYNKCLNFLLKIQRCVHLLSKSDLWRHPPAASTSGSRTSRYFKLQHKLLIFQRELLHFSKTLETYLKSQIHYYSTTFTTTLPKIQTLPALQALHRNFLSKILTLTLLGPDQGKLHSTILNVLNNGVTLREIWKRFASNYDLDDLEALEGLQKVNREFESLKENHRICMRFVVGVLGKSGMGDVLCRMDFNGFYEPGRYNLGRT